MLVVGAELVHVFTMALVAEVTADVVLTEEDAILLRAQHKLDQVAEVVGPEQETLRQEVLVW
jgi:uncharacterized protein YbcV (DUF1398 family)